MENDVPRVTADRAEETVDHRPSPRVSVVVPHYRDLENLEICLQALERQTVPRSEIEVIVADNNSPEGESAVAKVIAGRARLVIVPEKGAGPARNGGVAQARGEILAFTDSDCRPEPEWLAEGVEALKSHDFVGGRMTVLVDDPARMTPVEAFESVFAFNNQAYVTRRRFSVSANLFCSRALFAEVGGFLAGHVSEDQEWCLRARDLGYRIGYAPASVVGHPARKTWPDLLRKWRRVNSERYGLMTRSGRGRWRWLILTCALPASAFVHTHKALLSKKLGGLGQRLAAVGVLHKLRWWRLGDSLRLLRDKDR